MTSVDVVVCAHDERRLRVIRECLRAVRAGLREQDRLIVVVDHNEDLRELLAREISDEASSKPRAEISIVSNAGQRGLSAARNTGMRAGDGDILCFFDDDAVPEPGWRTAIDSAFSDSTITAIGGRIQPEFVDEHGQSVPAPNGLPAAHGWIYGCDYAGMAPDGATIRNPVGAAMALRRSAAHQVGDFSTYFGRAQANGAGAEETEYFLRLSSVLPQARIIRFTDFSVRHQVPVERTRWRYFVRRAFQEGRSKSLLASTAHGSTGSETDHLAGAIPSQFSADLRALARPGTGTGTGAGSGAVSASTTSAGDFTQPRTRLSALRSLWLNASVVAATGIGFVTGRNGALQQGHGHPAPAPTVSVVICTNGQSSYLYESLTSLAANHPVDNNGEPLSMEIIMVDNSLTGDLATRADLQHFAETEPRFRIVRAPIPGLSRARNVGIEAAQGELIAFTDDDAIVDKQWIQELLTGFEDPRVFCVTGRTTAYDLSKEVYRLFEELVSFDKGPVGRRWSLDSANTPPLYPLPAGSLGAGNNMAFRASAFDQLGGFAEELGAGRPTRGGEDLDMFRRVVLSGNDLVYRPEAVVKHRHRDSFDGLRRQFYGYGLGMTASLTRAILDDPTVLGRMAAEAPKALRHFLSIRSGRSAPSVMEDTPAEHMPAVPDSTPGNRQDRCTRLRLIGIEVLGLAAGPYVFISTRFKDALSALGFTEGFTRS